MRSIDAGVVDAARPERPDRSTMPSVVGRRDELDAIDGFLDVDLEPVVRRSCCCRGWPASARRRSGTPASVPRRTADYRVVTARPTEVETGLAFASLGDLLTPLLDTPAARPPRTAAGGSRRGAPARVGCLAAAAARRLPRCPASPASRRPGCAAAPRHRRRAMAGRRIGPGPRLLDPSPRRGSSRLPPRASCGRSRRAAARVADHAAAGPHDAAGRPAPLRRRDGRPACASTWVSTCHVRC